MKVISKSITFYKAKPLWIVSKEPLAASKYLFEVLKT